MLIMLRDGDELVIAAGAGHVQIEHAARLPAGRLDRRTGARRRPQPPHRRRGARAADPAREAGAGPTPRRRCSSRSSTAARASACWPPSIAWTATGAFSARRRAAARGLRGAGGDRGGHRASRWRPIAAAARMAAAEAERHRWARELHDETLQALGGLKVLLSSAARLEDPEAMRSAMRDATRQLSGDIESLRSLIAELRPPALDQLGLAPALTSLAQRTAAGQWPRDPFRRASWETSSGWRPRWRPRSTASSRSRSPTWSSTRAPRRSSCACTATAPRLEVSVADDGIGFDPEGRPPPGSA